MKHLLKTGLFYGSSGGNTKKVATMIANCFGSTKLIDVETANKIDLESFDFLIFGIPTWGVGDMQMDWEDFLKVAQKANLANKVVALFGLGDQKNYPNNFVDALGLLYKFIANKSRIIGSWPAIGYQFKHSKALLGGSFAGLVLDEDNEPHLTKLRIENWCEKLKVELGIASQLKVA